ncbi:muconolactone Delta-isomerase [Pseudoalteromonas sp. S1612]|uniref:muconolactone Delta-isomerase n=1 Tax=Pseudoalteromonas sp. S1612 TaxID=579507 RepID=UPI00110B7AD2|nr:muconolactone Delta-isomerase [Pseudoalteromonas sp. S1612]TMP57040.1 muconolactone delta-isomerase [Pseudoalteromonas sp. S1612]|tara:strand:+ start:1764 stop:2042 length:279 start_codon:yes stop_codon:yes gene_type:complete
MLFQVKMKVIPPTNLSEEEFSDIKAKEKQYAKELQKAGVWLHLWRVVGLYTNISIFEVEDNAHLHNVLSALPLFPFMEIEVTPLCAHPSSIK